MSKLYFECFVTPLIPNYFSDRHTSDSAGKRRTGEKRLRRSPLPERSRVLRSVCQRLALINKLLSFYEA